MQLGKFRFARCSAAAFHPLTLYSATIEASFFLSQAIWLFRTRSIRQRAKEAELGWDEFPEAQAWQNNRWRLPSIWNKSSASTVNEMVEGSVDASQQVATPIPGIIRDRKLEVEQCRQV